MKRRNLLITLVCVLFAAPVGLAVAGNDVFTIDTNKKGKSVKDFKHKEHKKRAGSCKTCHHKPEKKCGTCHKEAKGDAPSFKDAFHKRCKGCHATKAKKVADQKCKGCHG